MLEFVHSTGAKSADDSVNRRKVRSQAMRDFRRRQRAERDAANKPPNTHLAVPSDGSADDAVGQARERTASIGSESSSKPRRKSTARSTSVRTVPKMARRGGDSTLHLASGLSTSTSSSIFPAVPTTTYDLWDQVNNLPPISRSQSQPAFLHATLSSRASSPARSYEAFGWAGETDDPFDSLAQIGQMSAFCKSCSYECLTLRMRPALTMMYADIYWLRPGTDANTASNVLSQTWGHAKSSMLLAACCLASVGHLDAVQPNRPGGNYEMYKAKVLREISENMQSPHTATSDETIGALGCLLSYEMSRGSEEALTHLRGLKSIVDMKRGLTDSESSGLLMMLETLDLVHAVLFDGQPILTQQASTSPIDRTLSDIDVLEKLIPILCSEQAMSQRIPSAYTHNLAQFSSLLEDASVCLTFVVVGDAPPHALTTDAAAMGSFRSSLEAFGHRSCTDHPLVPDALHLGRACYLVMSILFNLVVNRIPHRHNSNKIIVNELSTAVRNVKDAAWDHFPYLRLYILLSGAVTATEFNIKGYFQAQLVRCIYQMGAGEWKRAKTFVLRFIEMKQVLERPERRSTPPAESPAMTASWNPFRVLHWGIPRHPNPDAPPGRSSLPAPDSPGTTLAMQDSEARSGFRHLSVAPSPLSHVVSHRTISRSAHVTPYYERDDPMSKWTPTSRASMSAIDAYSSKPAEEIPFSPSDWIVEH